MDRHEIPEADVLLGNPFAQETAAAEAAERLTESAPFQQTTEAPRETQAPREAAAPIPATNDPLAEFAREKQQREKSDDEPAKEQKSVAPELASAQFHYEITVTEPSKVNDALSSHIAYRVHTQTDNPAFKNRESTVVRRYRDFLWLYETLTHHHPGVIVPSVPEKSTLGRFAEAFIESRRASLETCLQKTARHPLLQTDARLQLFLESEQFNSDHKDREREALAASSASLGSSGEPGLLARLTSAVSGVSLFPTRPVDPDPWFEEQRMQLETLESQLKVFARAVDVLAKQRRELGVSMAAFGGAMAQLAAVEFNRPLAPKLEKLAQLHQETQALQDTQANKDIRYLATTLDEHQRNLASARTAFAARSSSLAALQNAQQQLARKREALATTLASAKIRTDRIAALEKGVAELEAAVERHQAAVNSISATLRGELDRFEAEKLHDFTLALRQFMQATAETEEAIAASWETYWAVQ